MSTRRTETVRTGRRYRLTVAPVVKPKPKPKPDAFGQRVVPRPQLAVARPEFRFYDASTRLNTAQRSDAGDQQNVFVAQSIETSVTASATQEKALGRQLIANCATSEVVSYLYSGRAAYSRCWPLQATTEVDGFNTSLTLRSYVPGGESESRTFALQSGTDWMRKMQPVADQLSAFDSVSGSIVWTDAERTAARANIAALELEKFDGFTASRVQRDAVLAPAVPSGLWEPGLASPYHYHPWEAWNSTDYKWTTTDTFYGAETAPLRVGAGKMEYSDIRVFLVPQRHTILFTWTSLYTLATLFLPPLLFGVAQTGTYIDRLPFYPYAFSFSAVADTGANDLSMSEWIEQSDRYSVAIQQDHGLEWFSPYAAVILNSRVDGRWTVRQRSLAAGQLAAIVDRRANGETARSYVWRRTELTRSPTVFDYGPLFTDLVTPMDRGGPFWSASPPYGPI